MKKKLNIQIIKVSSFVTKIPIRDSESLKAGLFSDYCYKTGFGWAYCPTNACTGVNCGSANPC